MKQTSKHNIRSVAFTADTALCIDPMKIRVLKINPNEMLLQSISTRHYWRIWIDGDCIRIWHKHKPSDSFHQHAVYMTIDDSLVEIIEHDLYQLNHRRPTIPLWTRTGLVQPKGRKH